MRSREEFEKAMREKWQQQRAEADREITKEIKMGEAEERFYLEKGYQDWLQERVRAQQELEEEQQG